MKEWLGLFGIVGALAAANYARGNGATSQLIAAEPGQVYAAFSDSYGQDEQGIASFGADTNIPYRATISRVPGKSLDVVVALKGVRAWEVHYDFAAEGAATRVTGEVEVHQEALKQAFAGTAAAEKLATRDIIYEAGLESELQRAKLQIEAGQPLGIAEESLFGAQWEPNGR